MRPDSTSSRTRRRKSGGWSRRPMLLSVSGSMQNPVTEPHRTREHQALYRTLGGCNQLRVRGGGTVVVVPNGTHLALTAGWAHRMKPARRGSIGTY